MPVETEDAPATRVSGRTSVRRRRSEPKLLDAGLYETAEVFFG